jgi:hypothetical protein
MAFWDKWFSSKPKAAETPVRTLEYKGCVIEARPFREGGGWQLAGLIVKEIAGERREHHFIRADSFESREQAAETAISKGQLIIDQLGDRAFS